MLYTMTMTSKTIRQLRENQCLLQKELAQKIGVSKPTISAWEQGSRSPNPSQRKKLCEFFKISEAELFGGHKPVEIKDVRIPVVSLASASDEKGFIFEPLSPYEYEYIDFSGCKAVRITSDSMAPIAYRGQMVIYSESAHVEEGDLVFVRFKAGEQYFKRYFTDHDKSLVTLVSVNNADQLKPHIKKRKEIDFMYKVVGVKF